MSTSNPLHSNEGNLNRPILSEWGGNETNGIAREVINVDQRDEKRTLIWNILGLAMCWALTLTTSTLLTTIGVSHGLHDFCFLFDI